MPFVLQRRTPWPGLIQALVQVTACPHHSLLSTASCRQLPLWGRLKWVSQGGLKISISPSKAFVSATCPLLCFLPPSVGSPSTQHSSNAASSPGSPLRGPQIQVHPRCHFPTLLPPASTIHLGFRSPCSLPGPQQPPTHPTVTRSERKSGEVPSLVGWSHSEVSHFSHRSFFLLLSPLACPTSPFYLRTLPAAPVLCAFSAHGPFSLPAAVLLLALWCNFSESGEPF